MFEPPHVHHDRLFLISVLGFVVNIIGIFVFQHGGASHGHSHDGGGHGHSHGGGHGHSHGGSSHGHSHGGSGRSLHYIAPWFLYDIPGAFYICVILSLIIVDNNL